MEYADFESSEVVAFEIETEALIDHLHRRNTRIRLLLSLLEITYVRFLSGKKLSHVIMHGWHQIHIKEQ